MMNRIELKQEAKGVVRTAAVSAYLFALLYLALTELLQGASVYVNGDVVLYMQTYFPNVPIPSYLYPVALPATAVTLVAVVCWLLRVLLQGGGFPRGTAHGIHKQVARRAVQPGPALAGAKVLQCTNILPCAQEHFLHHILRGRITAAQPAAIGGQLRTVGAKQFFQHGFSFGSGRGARPGFISSFYPR